MSKKKGGAAGPEVTYDLSDIVLAKVKGHPSWPARVVDPENAPHGLGKDKKRGQKGTYLVKFFQTGEYAYMRSSEIAKLEEVAIKAYLDDERKKGKELREAYQIALDPADWEQKQLQAEAERAKYLQDLEEAAKNVEEDELVEEDEAGEGSKKRKRKSEAKPKEAKKRKAETESKKPKKKAEKASTGGEEITGAAQVRAWRQKLQRTFLTETPARAEQMAEVNDIFDAIEVFDMRGDWLRETKLGKVLKRIGQLAELPEDDKYQIRSRARDLQAKWSVAFGGAAEAAPQGVEADDGPVDAAAIPEPSTTSPAKANGDVEMATTDAPAPTANGDAEEIKAD